MLLGKRQRPPIKRTTSLSEIKLNLNLPEPSDHQIQISSSSRKQLNNPPKSQLVTVDEHRQVHHALLDQRLLATVSPRGINSAYCSTHAGDFLRSCYLCKRHLVPRRDIYMYRGDRAFCSLECRQQQITVDERKEKGSVRSTVVVAGISAKGETVSAAV